VPCVNTFDKTFLAKLHFFSWLNYTSSAGLSCSQKAQAFAFAAAAAWLAGFGFG
jgi:hypothetical protein